MAKLGVRWTIGDVSDEGFAALRLATAGAWRLFGDDAEYVVCVNTITAAELRRRAGPLPPCVDVRQVTRADLPPLVRPWLDDALAEGVAWKLAPLRVFDDVPELALDNDCILWAVPEAMRTWLDDAARSALVAADVRACFGRFAAHTSELPRNSGIRGIPAGLDLGLALSHAMALSPGVLRSELDEQGLQVVALERLLPVHVVQTEDVSICSPFPPHSPELGRCGAHFVGLNAKALPWSYEGVPASELTRAHFASHHEELVARVGRAEGARRRFDDPHGAREGVTSETWRPRKVVS